jgi:hypothetical protein
MKTTHDSIQDLPIKKVKQSRPTREEILEGIGYTPLTFPASLHVPEALRAAEDLAMQDYIVGWTQGFWDFIHAHENPSQTLVLPSQGSAAAPWHGQHHC